MILWRIPGVQEHGLVREHTHGVMAPHCGKKKNSAVLQNPSRISKSLPNTGQGEKHQIKFVFFKSRTGGWMCGGEAGWALGRALIQETTLSLMKAVRVCRFPTPLCCQVTLWCTWAGPNTSPGLPQTGTATSVSLRNF